MPRGVPKLPRRADCAAETADRHAVYRCVFPRGHDGPHSYVAMFAARANHADAPSQPTEAPNDFVTFAQAKANITPSQQPETLSNANFIEAHAENEWAPEKGATVRVTVPGVCSFTSVGDGKWHVDMATWEGFPGRVLDPTLDALAALTVDNARLKKQSSAIYESAVLDAKLLGQARLELAASQAEVERLKWLRDENDQILEDVARLTAENATLRRQSLAFER
jgi:hypothetical protein